MLAENKLLKKIFPLRISMRIYIMLVVLFTTAFTFLASLSFNNYLNLIKNEQGKEFYAIAVELEQRLPEAFEQILLDHHATNKSAEEQVKILNSVLQPIVNKLSTSHPGIGMGYYSIELDSVLAIGPGFNPGLLTPVPHSYPYFNVYKTGKPELSYHNSSIGWHGKPILYQTYPIYRNGKLIGHTWANMKREDVYIAAKNAMMNIMVTGLLTLGATIFLTWLIFNRLRQGLENFAHALAHSNSELPKGILPELNPILELVKKRSGELKAANEQLLKIKQRMEYLLAHSPAVLFSSKVSGDFGATYVSDNVTSIFGYNAKNFIDIENFFLERIHPGDKQIVFEELKILNEKGNCSFEFRFLHQDGNYRWTHDKINLIRDERGNPVEIIGCWMDISERKLMEEEIKKKNQQIANILESITDGFFTLDRQWRFSYMNKVAERLWNRNKEELIGKMIWEVFPMAIGSIFYDEYHKAASQQTAVHFEGFSPAILKWVEVHVYPSRDGLSIYFRDITERKQAEESIKLNELRLEALLKLNHMTRLNIKEISDFVLEEMVKLTNSKIGWLGFLNEDETVIKMHAWSSHAMRECSLSNKPKFFTVETGGLWAEPIRQRQPVIINDYNALNSLKRGYPAGHVRLSRIMGIPVLDGKRIVMMAVVGNNDNNYDDSDVRQLALLLRGLWDILQRKKNEEALRLSEERFSKAFKASPGIIAITRCSDEVYIDVNEKFLSYTGYSREEIIDRSALSLNIWECSGEQTNFIRNIIKDHGSFSNQEIRLRLKSGEIREVLASLDIIQIDGEMCYLSIMQDLTEKKQLAKEMDRLDRLNLVGQMAAGIGHEIRNPMTSIRGFLQILKGKPECAKYSQYYSLMIDELDRANSIITEFLSLAKSKQAENKQLNLNSILEALEPLISADAMNSHKYIKLELAEIQNLLMDEKEIRQLILNLTRNGLEAMTKGCLTIKTYMDGEDIVLSVQDEGAGIAPDILNKIGTPFFTTKEDGTGLGLATCYSIAARHNATIDIDTSTSGTTFIVRFRKSINGNTLPSK